MDTSNQVERESPIACSLGVFSPEQERRWKELGQNWRQSIQEIRELPDGYALRLPSDAGSAIAAAEWMTLDRLCCPFFRFTLEIDREGGATWLRLTGRPGVKEFMQAAMRGE